MWILVLFGVGLIVGAIGVIIVSGGFALAALSPEAPDSFRAFVFSIVLSVGLIGALIGVFMGSRRIKQ